MSNLWPEIFLLQFLKKYYCDAAGSFAELRFIDIWDYSFNVIFLDCKQINYDKIHTHVKHTNQKLKLHH